MLAHYVFALQPRLWSYIGGIARTNHMKALTVGGMPDHVHVLLSLLPTMSIAKAIQLIKAGPSKWMHEQQGTRFEWQVGYGAFTIGVSHIPATVDYILNQDKHHAKKSFAEEWKMFLERHGLSEEDD